MIIIGVIICIIVVLCVIYTSSSSTHTGSLLPVFSNSTDKESSNSSNNDFEYDEDYEAGKYNTGDFCFDRDGRAYSKESEVLYFNRDGDTYQHKFVHDVDYFVNTKSGNRIETIDAYVDSDGYFYIIKDGLTHVENDPYTYTITGGGEIDDTVIDVTYQDEDGNIYYSATEASWSNEGKLRISGNTLQ